MYLCSTFTIIVSFMYYNLWEHKLNRIVNYYYDSDNENKLAYQKLQRRKISLL